MLRFGLLVIVVVVAGVCRVAPASAATVSHTNETVPLSIVVPETPCTGEDVLVTGDFHVVTNVVEDNAGGSHVVLSFAWAQLVGTGVTSGVAYHGQDGSHSAFASRLPQNELTAAFSMVLASSGAGGNLVVQGVFHETVDANGEVRALVEFDGATCTG